MGQVYRETYQKILESCEYWEIESISNFINFNQNGFSIRLSLDTSNDITYFKIGYKIQNSDNTEDEYFENLINPSNEQVVDINLNGFEFENVYVFNNSLLNENSTIELILYSSVAFTCFVKNFRCFLE